ncbi:hypothetical protein JCM8097_008254 [Rhodosporidiobolus ruineniae]
MTSRFLLVGGYNDFVPTIEFNPSKATLEVVHKSPTLPQPSWIEVVPNSDGKIFLTANELDEGEIQTLRLNEDRSLTPVDEASSGGEHTAYALTSNDGRFAYAINYAAFRPTGGNATSYALDPSTGKFSGPALNADAFTFSGSSIHPERQKAPHPHQVKQHPSLPVLFIPDLGTDEVRVFEQKEDGRLEVRESFKVPAGTGPRHLQFHPTAPYAYLLGEINNTVTVLSVSPTTGSLAALETLSLLHPFVKPDDQALWGGASILPSPDGRFLYTSTRNLGDAAPEEGKQDSLRVFRIVDGEARLEVQEDVEAGGVGAREFKLSGEGRGEYLAVALQRSKRVAVFKRDEETGGLEKVVVQDFDFTPTSIVWLQ